MLYLLAVVVIQVLVYVGFVAYNIVTEQHQCAPSKIKHEPIRTQTSGCFYANQPLTVAGKVGWSGTTTNFRHFHLNSTFKDQYFQHIHETKGRILGQRVDIQDTYYFLAGCKKIKTIECPQATVCLYIATQTNRTWEIETFRFSARTYRLPLHVKERLESSEYFYQGYQLIVYGPSRGDLCFNEIKWGVQFNFTEEPNTIVDDVYLSSINLPTNLPDGILGLQ
ncbi:hypothetical protein DSO57_1005585 [Entomophthora muscae]|uniref:Uncharacterized protein n=1 Tax=Entomophthora muscae TaxID=34485 RepID=A0ACC2USS5_9FUNG|nr:hypothetical protein DSO57_1005585 [Entomophthora muscae]